MLSLRAQKMVAHYWGSLEEAAKFMKHERRRKAFDGSEYILSGWLRGIMWPVEYHLYGEDEIYEDKLKADFLPGCGIVVVAEIIAALLVQNLISWDDCKFEGRSRPKLADRKTINAALRKVDWSGPFLCEEKIAVELAKRKANRKIEKLKAEKIRILKRLKEIDEFLTAA